MQRLTSTSPNPSESSGTHSIELTTEVLCIEEKGTHAEIVLIFRHFQTSHFPKNRLCVVQKQRQCASQPALANVHGGAPQVTALQCTAGGVVKRFYQAFNARDVEAMVDCVADDIEHNNLAYAKVFRGKQAAKAFYAAFVKIMPENASFFIEDTTGASPVTDGGSKVAVLWYDSAGKSVTFQPVHAAIPLMLGTPGSMCAVRKVPTKAFLTKG
jgi:hypothetical protein